LDYQARFRGLALSVLLLVVSYGIGIDRLLAAHSSISGPARFAGVLLTSAALFRFLVSGLFWLVSNIDFLLRLYWGPSQYLKGYWHYTSTRDGQKFVGVWRFSQDSYSVRVLAFGLDREYQRRFTSHSVGPINEIRPGAGIYEVVNSRDDPAVVGGPIFSMTRFVPDAPVGNRWWSRKVLTMHGETFTFGDKGTRHLNQNVVFTRHPDVRSDENVVTAFRALSVFDTASG
jgi:hypothetical protein